MTPAAIAAELHAAVDAALPLFDRVDEARTAIRPAPGRWCAREILGHLVDSACNNHRRFVAGQGPAPRAFDGYEQDAWVARQQYADVPFRDVNDHGGPFAATQLLLEICKLVLAREAHALADDQRSVVGRDDGAVRKAEVIGCDPRGAIGIDGNDVKYRGGSAIVDYLGQYLVAMADETAVMTATLEKAPLDAFRAKFPFHLDADAFSITGRTAS